MYIIVRIEDNLIVGSCHNKVSEIELSKRGRRLYEIDDADFNESIIGQTLTDYEVIS